jgi:hypothetical protein
MEKRRRNITKGEETLYLRIEKTQIRMENFGHPFNPLPLSLSTYIPGSDSPTFFKHTHSVFEEQ